MENVPWLFRIPGLRRYGMRLRRAERRAEALSARVHGLKGRQPAPAVLQQMLAERHRALLASRQARAAAAQRDADFLNRSATYADAVRLADDAPALRTRSVDIEGLAWCVPIEGSSGDGLAERILDEAWLPFHRILATREVALGTTMLDIGANVGTTSIPRVILGDFQYVYAAEPDPANYRCLVQNVLANGLRGFVLPDRVAIGATDGPSMLHRKGGIGAHRLTATRQSAADVSVVCWRLDAWVERLGVDIQEIGFVKVDTQGSESHVLRGAPHLLAQRHIAWQLEFSPRLLERAGSSAADLLEQVERHFSHFIDLAARTAPRSKPVSAIREALASMDGRFTDVILYNAAARS